MDLRRDSIGINNKDLRIPKARRNTKKEKCYTLKSCLDHNYALFSRDYSTGNSSSLIKENPQNAYVDIADDMSEKTVFWMLDPLENNLKHRFRMIRNMNGCPHNIASSLTAMGDKDSVLPSETDEEPL